MNKRQAVAVLVKLAHQEVKRLAVDANLHDMLGLQLPTAKEASRKRKRILEAIAMVEKENGKVDSAAPQK